MQSSVLFDRLTINRLDIELTKMLFSFLMMMVLSDAASVQAGVRGSVMYQHRNRSNGYRAPMKFDFAYVVKNANGQDEQTRTQSHDSSGFRGEYIVQHPHSSWQTMNFAPDYYQHLPGGSAGINGETEIPSVTEEEVLIQTGSPAAVQIVVEQEVLEVTVDSSQMNPDAGSRNPWKDSDMDSVTAVGSPSKQGQLLVSSSESMNPPELKDPQGKEDPSIVVVESKAKVEHLMKLQQS